MQLLPKLMVVVYAVAALSVIAELPDKQVSSTPPENTNLVCTKSPVAAVPYRPTEDQKVQMTRRDIVEIKDSKPLFQN